MHITLQLFCFIGYKISHLAFAKQYFWLLGHQSKSIIRNLLLH